MEDGSMSRRSQTGSNCGASRHLLLQVTLTYEDRCSIHTVNPYSCGWFDCKQSREEADALSLRGLMEVAKAWQSGDPYARLWMMLYHAGRIAPSPIEARARMRATLEAGECDGEDRLT